MSASRPSNPTARAPLTADRLRGCFTAIITPFTPDGASIDFARLDEQIALQAAGGVTGVVVSGTTGESPTLEHEEYERLVARAVETGRRHGLVVVAGTGSNSTAHAVALHRLALSLGADAGLSVNPYYNKPTQEGLVRHFTAVADSCDLPVILYNVPGRSGVGLSLDTIRTLARHPNVRALKDAAGNVDLTSETCAACPGLVVLSGDDPLTLPMMGVGAVGVVSVASNVVPDRVSALCRLELEGRREEALGVHRELAALSKALFLETNPIPVKAAMRLLGRDSGALRLPMIPASPATVERLRAVLTSMEVLQLAGAR
jgi:4-hydroxy-tetrahydrodipicolinate synthase